VEKLGAAWTKSEGAEAPPPGPGLECHWHLPANGIQTSWEK